MRTDRLFQALLALVLHSGLASAGGPPVDDRNPDALGYATFELAPEIVHGSWNDPVGGQTQSFTSVNLVSRVDIGLLEAALSSGNGGTRIGDYEGFTFGIGGASNDALINGFDLMYEVAGGLRAEITVNRDVELRVRGGVLFTGDIARDTASGRATWIAWQAAAGLRYQKLYVEAGPDIVWGSGGGGVQALAFYRWRSDSTYFRDVGLRVEHIAGNRDGNAGQPYSETLVNLLVGTH